MQKLINIPKRFTFSLNEEYKNSLHKITFNDLIQDIYFPTIADHTDNNQEIYCICWDDEKRMEK